MKKSDTCTCKVVLKAEWQDYKVNVFPFDRCYLGRILAPRECRESKKTKINKKLQQAAEINQEKNNFKQNKQELWDEHRVATFSYPFKEESKVTLPLGFDHTTMHPLGLLDPPYFSFSLWIWWLKIHFWCKPNRQKGNLFCMLRARDHLYCSQLGENTAYNKNKIYLIFVHKADLILFRIFKTPQWWTKNKFWTPVIVPHMVTEPFITADRHLTLSATTESHFYYHFTYSLHWLLHPM